MDRGLRSGLMSIELNDGAVTMVQADVVAASSRCQRRDVDERGGQRVVAIELGPSEAACPTDIVLHDAVDPGHLRMTHLRAPGAKRRTALPYTVLGPLRK